MSQDQENIIAVSWGGESINDGTSYVSGVRTSKEWGLPDIKVNMVERDGAWPVIGGVGRPEKIIELALGIVGTDLQTLRDQLLRWFDPEDETKKAFVVTDENGSNSRYVNAICKSIKPARSQGRIKRTFVIVLVVDNDVRWRATSETTDVWNITASGQTNVVNNGGTDDAYPIFEITPTAAKSGGYAYKHFIPLLWRTPYVGTQYPVRIGPLDTGALTPAKMQADGDDLRVFANGIEIDRWLVDMDTANTYIWVNLNFAASVSATLQTNIPASGSISSIEVGEDVYDFPEEGIVFIDDEVFTYTARDLFEEKLTGITREVKGSSEAAHTTADTVYWLQHDLILAYGNAAATAPDVDDDYKPIFSLDAADSDNTEWLYESFGDQGGIRAGQWMPTGNVTLAGYGGVYTAAQRTLAPGEYSVIGVWIGVNSGPWFGWVLNNPCGIINADWASGQMRSPDVTVFNAWLGYWVRDTSWWAQQATIAAPAVNNVWDTWSEAAGAAWAEANSITMHCFYRWQDVEVGTVTVTLSATDTPTVDMSACAEQGNYPLSCTIENQATGELITVTFGMEVDETLIVNTDLETVIYEADESNQFQAVGWDATRHHWLRLVPGSNSLEFIDVDTDTLTIDTVFEPRYY